MDDERRSTAQAVLNVDERVFNDVIPRMNELDFFSKAAGGRRVENRETFQFAFAVGFHNDLPVGISEKHQGGFVRTSYLSSDQTVLMKAAHYAQSDYSDAETLRNERDTYDLAEAYSNGGFQVIEGDLDSNMSSEEIANALIKEMDELYGKYTGNDLVI